MLRWRQFYLQMGVLCLRYSLWWCGVAALVLISVFSGAAAYWSLKKQTLLLQEEQQQVQTERRLMRQSPTQVSETSAVVAPETRFKEILADPAWVSEDLKKLFKLAQRQGLSNEKGEYKMSRHGISQVQSLEIILPVKGSYPAIRQWVESILLEFPHASVEEVAFQRESIAVSSLEAKVKLTLWLQASSPNNSLGAP